METDGKEVFCYSNQCEESVNEYDLLEGVRVCLEVRSNKDSSKYKGKIYGLEENKEIILLKHRIKTLKRIKYPCLKIFHITRLKS